MEWFKYNRNVNVRSVFKSDPQSGFCGGQQLNKPSRKSVTGTPEGILSFIETTDESPPGRPNKALKTSVNLFALSFFSLFRFWGSGCWSTAVVAASPSWRNEGEKPLTHQCTCRVRSTVLPITGGQPTPKLSTALWYNNSDVQKEYMDMSSGMKLSKHNSKNTDPCSSEHLTMTACVGVCVCVTVCRSKEHVSSHLSPTFAFLLWLSIFTAVIITLVTCVCVCACTLVCMCMSRGQREREKENVCAHLRYL